MTAATRRLTKAASLRPAGRGKENSKISAHGYGGLGAYPILLHDGAAGRITDLGQEVRVSWAAYAIR